MDISLDNTVIVIVILDSEVTGPLFKQESLSISEGKREEVKGETPKYFK